MKNKVIETKVDILLNYLKDKREATVSQASEELGIPEDRIRDWTDALAKGNIIERTHTFKGIFLSFENSGV